MSGLGVMVQSGTYNPLPPVQQFEEAMVISFAHLVLFMEKLRQKSIKLGWEMATKKELEDLYTKVRKVLYDIR